jgi:hypothetical protein
MSSVAFDTLKFVEKLESAGVPLAQAKATAEAFAEATGQDLVTKSDLKETEFRLEAKIESVKAEVALVKWMIGFLALLSAVALKLFLR